MDKFIDLFVFAAMFSTMDADRECLQIKLAKYDQDKTAFSSHHDLYFFWYALRIEESARDTPTINVVLWTMIKELFESLFQP